MSEGTYLPKGIGDMRFSTLLMAVRTGPKGPTCRKALETAVCSEPWMLAILSPKGPTCRKALETPASERSTSDSTGSEGTYLPKGIGDPCPPTRIPPPAVWSEGTYLPKGIGDGVANFRLSFNRSQSPKRPTCRKALETPDCPIFYPRHGAVRRDLPAERHWRPDQGVAHHPWWALSEGTYLPKGIGDGISSGHFKIKTVVQSQGKPADVPGRPTCGSPGPAARRWRHEPRPQCPSQEPRFR